MKYLIIVLSIILLNFNISFANISISSTELFSIYDENEIKGDSRYKGKELIVKGEVESVGRDLTNKIYISLEGDGFIRHVQCFFGEEYIDEVSEVKKGSVIEVHGICRGMFINVMIDKCKIVR